MYAAFDACLSRSEPSRPGTVTWTREWLRFQKLINAEAWLDAAMTLVPEGWGWLVSQPNAKAIASGLLKKDTPVMGEVQNGIDRRFTVAAATPALALTAAALRAHAAIAGEG